MMSGVPRVKAAWGTDPILTHTRWKKPTPKSGCDNLVVSGRDRTADHRGKRATKV